MKIKITNLTATAVGPILGLPGGGIIPASGNRTFPIAEASFSGGDEDMLGLGKELRRLKAAGTITYDIYPEEGDIGGRVYACQRTFTLAEIKAAATLKVSTLVMSEELPANAISHGASVVTDVDVAGGGETVAALTVGFTNRVAAFHTSSSVFTGAAAAGPVSSAKHIPIPAAGEKITAVLTTTTNNVSSLTAGQVTITAFYSLV